MIRQKPGTSPPFAGARTPDNRIDPSPATADRNTVRGLPPKSMDDNEVAMRKGGKVKAVMKPAKAKGRRK